jgi:hypothetical protein
MHMRIGMHMHPDSMAPIRFEPRMLARASAARRRVMTDGEEAGMDVRVCDVERRLTTMDTKNAGRAAPPGESLFSSLFSVAARGGKSPRESVVTVSLGRQAHRVNPLEPRSCLHRRLDRSSRHPRGILAACPGRTYIIFIVAVEQFPTRRPPCPLSPTR